MRLRPFRSRLLDRRSCLVRCDESGEPLAGRVLRPGRFCPYSNKRKRRVGTAIDDAGYVQVERIESNTRQVAASGCRT